MKPILVASILALALPGACSSDVTTADAPEPIHSETNSVYYWKTVLNLDTADLAFIRRHNIGRIYLRLFDVSEDNQAILPDERAVPNASLKVDCYNYNILHDSLAHIEFVPVVYITLEALKSMHGSEDVLASNIVGRVKNMCGYNGLPNVSELQLDCDWTTSTQSSFFSLCDSVRSHLASRGLPWRLSSTIRLHQLSLTPPPVDNGVLMVYNTGSFNNPDAANSIIAAADIKPYLKHLPSYPLHLDIAYPVYSWQLLFRNRQFIGLMNGINVADSLSFTPIGNNSYRALRDVPYNNRIIRPGDIVRLEESHASEVLDVSRMIEGCLPDTIHSNILYHFDLKNLSKYTPDEIDRLFSTAR